MTDLTPATLDELEALLKALRNYDIAVGGLDYSPADDATGNAVICPAEDPKGDWFTLVGGGRASQQNALCDVIVAAVNAMPALIAAARRQHAEGWRDISTAPTLDRVFVAGWQEPRGRVVGYWWVHEDYIDEHGVPIDHPHALWWQPFPKRPAAAPAPEPKP